MSMDIYAPAGTRVRFTNHNAGYNHNQEKARKHLVLNGVYTVLRTSVHSWYTDVYFKELPEHGFNSVLFETVETKETKMETPETPVTMETIKEFCAFVHNTGGLLVNLAEFDEVRQSVLEAQRDFPLVKTLVILAARCVIEFAEGRPEEALRLRNEALAIIAKKDAELAAEGL